MKILEPSKETGVEYYSSISQHKNKLAVVKKGEWCPISFDCIDYIDCKKIHSHRAVVTDGDDIGYNFPVGECRFYTDSYVYHDENGNERHILPEWFGPGFYDEALTDQAFINADTCSLGVRNGYVLRVGLSYALADKNIPPVE